MRTSDRPNLYSPALDRALAFAADQFRTVPRKGSGRPYLGHLLQVATWVMEYGGDEAQIIAALLHDYLEDIPGARADTLQRLFGADVARMVETLSDCVATDGRPKPPWRPRKERYIERLRTADPRVKLIATADKLHNLTSIESDLAASGAQVWERFSAPKEACLWYYAAVADALGSDWDHPLLARLANTLDRVTLAAR